MRPGGSHAALRTLKTLSFTCNDSMQSLTAVLYLLARFLFPQRPLCNIATASGSRIQPQLRRFLRLYFVPCLVTASAGPNSAGCASRFRLDGPGRFRQASNTKSPACARWHGHQDRPLPTLRLPFFRSMPRQGGSKIFHPGCDTLRGELTLSARMATQAI